MIIATRIPMLTERLRAATSKAANAQQHGTGAPASVPEPSEAITGHLVQGLECLGYKVTLERVAA